MTSPSFLDIRNEYELERLCDMCYGIGRLLVRMEALGAPTEVIEGIQLFDEVDDRNVILKRGPSGYLPVGGAEASARTWGATWARCASSLLLGLGDLERGISRYQLVLPSITSHYEETRREMRWPFEDGAISRNSLYYKLSFFWHFLEALDQQCPLSGLSTTFLRQQLGWMMWCFDHKQDKESEASPGYGEGEAQRIGPLHICNLKLELDILRYILLLRGYTTVRIGVVTGMSVADLDDAYPTWWTGTEEEFQAQEVWRRLAGSLASGADGAFWRAWMSELGKDEAEDGKQEHYSMGLREDTVDLGDTSAVPAMALPRDSWFASARLVQFIQGPHLVEFLHPKDIPSTTSNPPDASMDHLVIIRIQATNRTEFFPFKYLLLVDPTKETPACWQVATTWSDRSGTARSGRGTPDAVSIEESTDPEALGTASATFPGSTPLFIPGTFTITTGESPLLIESTREVSFALSLKHTGVVTSVRTGRSDPMGRIA